MKGVFSLLAFILLAVSISSFTTHVFLQSAFDSYDSAKSSALEKNEAVVDSALAQFYSNLSSDQKANIEQLKLMTPEMKQTVLVPQCSSESLKNEPFCSSEFISGRMTLDDVFKENIKKELDRITVQSIDLFKTKLEAYEKVNLILVGIITGILSLLIYILTYGIGGIQKFAGNASWLALLSAVSFKVMPMVMNKIMSVSSSGQDSINQQLNASLSQTITDWLIPAMDKGFMVSLIIALIAFLVWGILKLKREYMVATD